MEKEPAKQSIVWEYNIRPPLSNLQRNSNDEQTFGNKIETANAFASKLEANLILYNTYWVFLLTLCIFATLLIGEPFKKIVFGIFGLILFFTLYVLLLLIHWKSIKALINEYNKKFDDIKPILGPTSIKFLCISYKIYFS